MKRILAIDLGTQSIRAGLMTPEGRAVAISQQAHSIDSPQPGWAQQSPVAWWDITISIIRDVLAKSGMSSSEIAGVITCGQMHGPTGIGFDGNITTEFTQLWCDKRCEPQCIEVRSSFNERILQENTGNVPGAGWTGLKVKWIKDNQPDIYDSSFAPFIKTT